MGRLRLPWRRRRRGFGLTAPRVTATPLPDPACLVLPHTSGAGAGLGADPAVGALSWQRGKAAEQGMGMSSPQTGAHSSSFYFHFWSYLASRRLACSHLPRALSGDQYSPGAPMPSAIWAVQARADGAGHPQHLLELLLGRGQVVTSPTSALVCAP